MTVEELLDKAEELILSGKTDMAYALMAVAQAKEQKALTDSHTAANLALVNQG